jgi:hypothetical protein
MLSRLMQGSPISSEIPGCALFYSSSIVFQTITKENAMIDIPYFFTAWRRHLGDVALGTAYRASDRTAHADLVDLQEDQQ